MEFLRAPLSYPHDLPDLAVILASIIGVLCGFYLKSRMSPLRGKNLPPGSLGLPLVGESITFLRAQKEDKTWEWVETRLAKYGPVFKTSLMGAPTVVATGQAGNRFVFSSGDEVIGRNQILSAAKIFGRYSLMELTGDRYKLIKGAMINFLRPESLQGLVVDMDAIIKHQLSEELAGKETVHIVPLMKKITFNVTCSLLFGLADGKEKDDLFKDFSMALRGTWAIPVNFPGTIYWKACKARGRICKLLSDLISRRKKERQDGRRSSQWDVISNFLDLRDENGGEILEEEIIDNLVLLIIASHDTSAILLTHIIRKLARDPPEYEKVFQDQKEAVRGITIGRNLTWFDMQKMKYTWKVAQELMRLTPPIFGNFKRAVRDATFGGFDIPNGWQVFWVASATHMDKTIFLEPKKFDPSRFDIASKSFPSYTYIPFGAGPHMCPGADFARIEVLLVVHHLIMNYQWEELIANEPIIRDPMPYPAAGLPVRLHSRESMHLEK